MANPNVYLEPSTADITPVTNTVVVLMMMIVGNYVSETGVAVRIVLPLRNVNLLNPLKLYSVLISF